MQPIFIPLTSRFVSSYFHRSVEVICTACAKLAGIASLRSEAISREHVRTRSFEIKLNFLFRFMELEVLKSKFLFWAPYSFAFPTVIRVLSDR